MISQKEVAIKISVIMPALNEEAGIGDALKAIRDEAVSSASEVEVIVVDGGSDDKTCEVAAEFAHVMVSSERGRAVQMNAGALCATGDVLVPADVRPRSGHLQLYDTCSIPRHRAEMGI